MVTTRGAWSLFAGSSKMREPLRVGEVILLASLTLAALLGCIAGVYALAYLLGA